MKIMSSRLVLSSLEQTSFHKRMKEFYIPLLTLIQASSETKGSFWGDSRFQLLELRHRLSGDYWIY